MVLSLLNEKRFPIQKLCRELALKVAEKIPFGTFESQCPDIGAAKWFPFLSFQLCSRFTADLCRSLNTRIYYAVKSVKFLQDETHSVWSILVFAPNAKHHMLKGEEVENMNFAFDVVSLYLEGYLCGRYEHLLSRLQKIRNAHEVRFQRSKCSVEEICRLIEDFEVEILKLIAVEDLLFDLLLVHPIMKQLKGLTIMDSTVNLTEDAFLKLSLDHFSISKIAGNMTSTSLNKFLQQWKNRTRQINFVALYFEDVFVFENRSLILEGLDSTPSSRNSFLVKRVDGEALEIRLAADFVSFRSCGVKDSG